MITATLPYAILNIKKKKNPFMHSPFSPFPKNLFYFIFLQFLV